MDIINSVNRAMHGDEEAINDLYYATYPKLRAVAVSILKNEDDAEDIVQDSYIKAFSSLQQLDNANRFEPWLCRIVSNKCKDYLKKNKPLLFSSLSDDDEDSDPVEWSIEDESKEYDPEAVLVSSDTKKQIMELLNSLPDEQRICLVYHVVQDMKISEIARLLEVSENTVKSRINYAKSKMKTKIDELEKKGIKLRGITGFALFPFIRSLFTSSTVSIPPFSAQIVSGTAAAGASAVGTTTATAATTTVSATTATTAASTVAATATTTAAASTATAASTVASTAAATTAASTVATTVAAQATKFVALKIIAGIVAAAAVTATVVGVVSNNDTSTSSSDNDKPSKKKPNKVVEEVVDTEDEDSYLDGFGGIKDPLNSEDEDDRNHWGELSDDTEDYYDDYFDDDDDDYDIYDEFFDDDYSEDDYDDDRHDNNASSASKAACNEVVSRYFESMNSGDMDEMLECLSPELRQEHSDDLSNQSAMIGFLPQEFISYLTYCEFEIDEKSSRYGSTTADVYVTFTISFFGEETESDGVIRLEKINGQWYIAG